MTQSAFTLFDTAIGACAIAWGERGVVGVWLPEQDAAATRGRISRRLPDAREASPTPDVQRTIEAIVDLLAGAPSNLTAVSLDMDGVPEFNRRVYAIAREIQPGRTLSYGEIAARLGDPSQARAVGQALGQNPFPIVVPCHRVLAANGKTGGFSAPGGVSTKLRLLEIERARASAIPDRNAAIRATLPTAGGYVTADFGRRSLLPGACRWWTGRWPARCAQDDRLYSGPLACHPEERSDEGSRARLRERRVESGIPRCARDDRPKRSSTVILRSRSRSKR